MLVEYERLHHVPKRVPAYETTHDPDNKRSVTGHGDISRNRGLVKLQNYFHQNRGIIFSQDHLQQISILTKNYKCILC